MRGTAGTPWLLLFEERDDGVILSVVRRRVAERAACQGVRQPRGARGAIRMTRMRSSWQAQFSLSTGAASKLTCGPRGGTAPRHARPAAAAPLLRKGMHG